MVTCLPFKKGNSQMKCRMTGCNEDAKAREMCNRHYNIARKWVVGRGGSWNRMDSIEFDKELALVESHGNSLESQRKNNKGQRGASAMKCLTEGCERSAVARGLCRSCYQIARNHVKSGKITWKELEASGYVQVATKTNSHKSPFTAMLEKAKLLKSIKNAPDGEIIPCTTPVIHSEVQELPVRQEVSQLPISQTTKAPWE
jgi:hypothetical protein